MLYAILEDGALKGEWLLVEAFVDQDEAIECLLDLAEQNEGSNYRLVEFKANKVII